MNIVVAFNESEDARAALAWGAEIARHAKAEVHVVHAVPNPSVPSHSSAHAIEELMTAATEAARKRIDAEVAALRARNIAAEAHVGRWLVVDGVIDIAKKTGAGVIVVGRRGSSRASEILIGTISSEIVRLAPTSVLVVPRGAAPASGDRVLVAVDGSAPSLKALQVARKVFPDAPLVAMSVANALAGAIELHRAVEQARLDVAVEEKHRSGDPAAELLAESGDGRYQAIVLGPRGMGMLKGLLLGSVSEKVVQLAKVPVLIAR